MSATYPNPCTHCGACCLFKQCPVSLTIHGPMPRGKVCPSLSFTGDTSSCAMVAKLGPAIMGSGQGCCISATMYKNGKPFEFADLSPEMKIAAVRQIRSTPGLVYDKRTLEPVA